MRFLPWRGLNDCTVRPFTGRRRPALLDVLTCYIKQINNHEESYCPVRFLKKKHQMNCKVQFRLNETLLTKNYLTNLRDLGKQKFGKKIHRKEKKTHERQFRQDVLNGFMDHEIINVMLNNHFESIFDLIMITQSVITFFLKVSPYSS